MRYQAARASSAGRPSAARPTSGRTSHISLSRLSNFLNHTSRDGWALWIWKKAWRCRFCVCKLRDKICSKDWVPCVPLDLGFLPQCVKQPFFSSLFLWCSTFVPRGIFSRLGGHRRKSWCWPTFWGEFGHGHAKCFSYCSFLRSGAEFTYKYNLNLRISGTSRRSRDKDF